MAEKSGGVLCGLRVGDALRRSSSSVAGDEEV